MMLLENITIICHTSEWHEKKVDIWFENGKIGEIRAANAAKRLKSTRNTTEKVVFDGNKKYIAPSFVDVGTHTGDPGREQKDDLSSIAAAAKAGGFGILVVAPNTLPVTNTKSEIAYLQQQTQHKKTRFEAIAAITQDAEGKKLNEIYDLRTAGAVAFSDGSKPMQNPSVLLRALEYVRPFGGIILNQPHDSSIVGGKGQMSEGYFSTLLGMKGAPKLAETLMLQRDIALLKYSESRLLTHCISTAESTELVAEAKQNGLQLYASVAVANLAFTDAELVNFDSNYKVFPHLREENDRKALIESIKNGTIDLICSNHTPQEEDCKNLEFQYADFGIIALETTFAMLCTYTDLSAADIVAQLSINPRHIFNLPKLQFLPNEIADYTVFDMETEWTVNNDTLFSKSRNTPLLGKKLRGVIFNYEL